MNVRAYNNKVLVSHVYAPLLIKVFRVDIDSFHLLDTFVAWVLLEVAKYGSLKFAYLNMFLLGD